MLIKEEAGKLKFIKLEPVQILALGFAAVILIGALLLCLPISSAEGKFTPFIDCLFTSTSAVCVTGLVTLDTGTYWSTFGQIIIMLLIETGGLGFMTFATFFAVILGRRISLKERLIMQEAFNAFNIQGMVRLMLYVMGITFAIEGVGALILMTQFIPQYGISKGIYYGIFHSVSAFCNAGFDLIGDFKSLTPYAENVTLNLTICALIVIGGIGFAVITEVINNRGFKRLSLHTKVVLTTTALLILSGAVLFFLLEYANPKTMGALSFKGKVLASVFASITPRTAGFNTISTSDMTTAGKFLTIILMFIGASPGSTGGGIKTSTFTLLFMTVISVIRGREDTEIFKKRIGRSLVYRALAIIIIAFGLVILTTMVLSITQDGDFVEFLYEATSAFGTVGLSLGLTTRLNIIGKIIIILTMYSGRVGPLTLTLAFARKAQVANSNIKYPEDKLLVG
ncbi:trk system potassium uptake protein TrkH [Caloramator quimbayensis]|uniref:Trk system potassium uptake protein TrkH n=1 Tax=Caloramator quimbayensis TaxID=1147123 RepID=A0A1T4XIY2_9CLOT|nr:TrkH family potassium uptake protein [Caloramator quimbayensis]SKA89055.1 trk system potassium uptake protein TrkH [Caloramator quimbayensis]